MGYDCLTFDTHTENKDSHCGAACQSFILWCFYLLLLFCSERAAKDCRSFGMQKELSSETKYWGEMYLFNIQSLKGEIGEAFTSLLLKHTWAFCPLRCGWMQLVEILIREALNNFELRHYLVGVKSPIRNTISCWGFILNWNIVWLIWHEDKCCAFRQIMNKTLKLICNTVRLMTVVILGIFIIPQDFQTVIFFFFFQYAQI